MEPRCKCTMHVVIQELPGYSICHASCCARKRLGTLKHSAAQHNNDVIVVVPPPSKRKSKDKCRCKQDSPHQFECMSQSLQPWATRCNHPGYHGILNGLHIAILAGLLNCLYFHALPSEFCGHGQMPLPKQTYSPRSPSSAHILCTRMAHLCYWSGWIYNGDTQTFSSSVKLLVILLLSRILSLSQKVRLPAIAWKN